jgi:predicted NAD/FAD-dependent oxidoreductase
MRVQTQVRVAPPERVGGRWRLRNKAGEVLGQFDALIVSAPAPQAAARVRLDKICSFCGRRFAWLRKWAENGESVRY